jgi:hypothetical protein
VLPRILSNYIIKELKHKKEPLSMRNNYLDIKKKEREVSPLHTNSLFRRNDGNRKSALKYQSNNNCYRQNPPINEKPTSKTFKKKKDTFITSDIFPQLFVPV